MRIVPIAPLVGILLGAGTSMAYANGSSPGEGLTGPFEIEFMQMTIDHHLVALRMTELAAGTDEKRDANPEAEEGTAPTPGFQATPSKSSSSEIESLARRNNRMQREEMRMLKKFLRDWYNIEYQPRVRPESQPLLQAVESAAPGAAFDHAFLESFSRHHFTLLQPVNGCLTGTDLRHFELRRLCSNMWHSQTSDIDEMRHGLAKMFGIKDYQPFQGKSPLEPQTGAPRGQHSGSD